MKRAATKKLVSLIANLSQVVGGLLLVLLWISHGGCFHGCVGDEDMGSTNISPLHCSDHSLVWCLTRTSFLVFSLLGVHLQIDWNEVFHQRGTLRNWVCGFVSFSEQEETNAFRKLSQLMFKWVEQRADSLIPIWDTICDVNRKEIFRSR